MGGAKFFATATDPRGRVCAAGQARSGEGVARAAVACFNASGAPDERFGVRGFFELSRGDGAVDDAFYAIAIDARGRVIAAGKAGSGDRQKALLVRLTESGALDDTFGDPKAKKIKRGIVIGSGEEFLDDAFAAIPPEKAAPDEAFLSVAVDERGRVVAAGYTGDRGERVDRFRQTLVARFSDVGELDPAFFTVGYSLGNGARKPWGAFAHDEFSAVALLSDGSVIAAGFSSDDASRRRALLVKYRADGEHDRDRFGDGETRGYVLGPANELTSIALTPDAKILLGGRIDGRAMIARRGATGGLEQSFTLGTTTSNTIRARALPGGRALLSDGHALFAFDPSGAIDPANAPSFARTSTRSISDLAHDPKSNNLYLSGELQGRGFVARIEAKSP